jgi:acyl-CoA dehydrogenase
MIQPMLFELPPAYNRLRDEAVALADVIRPFAADADAMSSVHPGIRDALAASGLASVVVPRAYGGRDETVDPVAVCVVREVLMATSSHADSLFALQGIGSFALTRGPGSHRA